MNDKELMPPPMAPIRPKQATKATPVVEELTPSTYGLQLPKTKPNTIDQTENTAVPEEQNAQTSTDILVENTVSTQPSVELQYKPPFWSAPPQHALYLEVLKNGSIVEKVDLATKGHFLIGRLPICDVILDHQSISRQHAVIQHRDNGESFLYDLGSTHGTIVNKRPIKSKSYFPLRIGDILKFGQSTRLFVIGGPEELEKEQQQLATKRREEALRRKMEEATNIKTYTPLIELFSKSNNVMPMAQSEAVTWGIDMDDDAIYAHEKLEQEELFAGNEDDAEAFLKHEKKIHHATLQSKKQKIEEDEDSSDDEFFDRTKKRSAFDTRGKVETYSSLVAAKGEVEAKKAAILKKLKDTNNAATDMGAEDSLDAFMNSNAQSIMADNQTRLRTELSQLEKESDRITKLISIAAPALKPIESQCAKSIVAENIPKIVPHVFATVSKSEESTTEAGIKEKHVLSEDIPTEFRIQTSHDDDAMPTADATAMPSSDQNITEEPEKKHNKKEKQRERKKDKEKENQKRIRLEEYESKYDAWVPPSNQSGDGRTTLNEKLGY